MIDDMSLSVRIVKSDIIKNPSNPSAVCIYLLISIEASVCKNLFSVARICIPKNPRYPAQVSMYVGEEFETKQLKFFPSNRRLNEDFTEYRNAVSTKTEIPIDFIEYPISDKDEIHFLTNLYQSTIQIFLRSYAYYNDIDKFFLKCYRNHKIDCARSVDCKKINQTAYAYLNFRYSCTKRRISKKEEYYYEI